MESRHRTAVLGCDVAGPGSGLSQEPMSGVRSVTLDLRVVPDCPPGPVAWLRFWSASSWAWTALDSRLLRPWLPWMSWRRPASRRRRRGLCWVRQEGAQRARGRPGLDPAGPARHGPPAVPPGDWPTSATSTDSSPEPLVSLSMPAGLGQPPSWPAHGRDGLRGLPRQLISYAATGGRPLGRAANIAAYPSAVAGAFFAQDAVAGRARWVRLQGPWWVVQDAPRVPPGRWRRTRQRSARRPPPLPSL